MRHHKGISNRSVLLMYQLRRCDNVSAWSRKSKLVTKMSLFFGCKAVGFYGVSCDSIPFRYRLVCHYDVSKTVLFRHQIWLLYKLLNWPVSLRYHFYLHTNENNEFEISATTWNNGIHLPNGSYSASDSKVYFEYLIKVARVVNLKLVFTD